MIRSSGPIGRTLLCIGIAVALGAVRNGAVARTTMGVKGGVETASFRSVSNPLVDYGNRWGFSGGIFAACPIAPAFAVQVEAAYLSRGASLGKSLATNINGDPIGEFETFHIRDDLGLSLLARFAPASHARVAPYVLIGGTWMQELREEYKSTGAYETKTSADDLKNTDYALALGGGIETPLGPGRALLELRYDHGLPNVSRVAGGSVRTATWRVLTGYAFP